MATLINGDGNAAVYAAQDSDWFAGVEGNTTKILKVGAKMEYEIEDANTIAIKNGVLVTKEGRRVQIDAGAIDEFIIPTGTQGVTRYFIIGYHLYTDASSNQLCETFVQLMANGTDTIPEDTFRGGSTDVYVSLYRVKQDGITLDTIQSLLPEGVDLDGIGDEIDDIKDDIDQINSDLTELEDWTLNHLTRIGKSGNTLIGRYILSVSPDGQSSYSGWVTAHVNVTSLGFTSIWSARTINFGGTLEGATKLRMNGNALEFNQTATSASGTVPTLIEIIGSIAS